MKEFITKYKPYALEIQCKTGISHLLFILVILVQSVLETGWGKNVPEWGKGTTTSFKSYSQRR